MHINLPGVTIMASSMLVSSCASHTIRASQYNPVGQEQAHATVSIAGRAGLSSDGTGYSAIECRGDDLAQVEVRRNLGQGIVTLITLGIVSPATIYFYCEKQEIPPPCDCDDDDGL